MRILVDMDGVIADFDKAVLDEFKARHPGEPYIPKEQRTTFYVKSQYPKELQPLVEEIYCGKGFYRNLPPVEGGIEALKEMETRHEVFICTSPLLQNPYCIEEKIAWMQHHLGKSWVDRTIITKDKTLIIGDFLIDDKPRIDGIERPTWEHVLYDQPYNRQVTDRGRLTWKDWREVLETPRR